MPQQFPGSRVRLRLISDEANAIPDGRHMLVPDE